MYLKYMLSFDMCSVISINIFWKQESLNSKDFSVYVKKQQLGLKAYGNFEAAGQSSEELIE